MTAEAFWSFGATWMHLTGAVCCGVLAVCYARARVSPDLRVAALAALMLTALWSVVSAAFSPLSGWAMLAEGGRQLGWLWLLYRLFAPDGRHESAKPIRPLVISLLFLELCQPFLLVMAARADANGALDRMILDVQMLFRLLMAVGALMLVHNLYAGASAASRNLLRWPASALAAMWFFDLNFYAMGYLSKQLSPELAALRGLVTVAVNAPLAIAASGWGAELKVKPSRQVTFQSLSLLVIGAYLVVMVGLARSIMLIGGSSARFTQVGFLFAASVAALLWLPSQSLRRWLRVTVLKHLFQHRYDYRAEWLRFTRTIGTGGDDERPLHQRVVQVLSDITDSPGGILLLPGEDGGLVLAARWQCPSIEVPAAALGPGIAAFLEREGYIVDLDDARASGDGRADLAEIPDWLREEAMAWVLVPLIHYERLTGAVLLCRPAVKRTLDWEDLDLLRVVGRQLGSYLAEQSGQEALNEAVRFEEFNRRIAFVMHDIKNLASQLSLLARNAERHADKKEFRADMLITLRNSADKLNGLLARLGRYGAQAWEKPEVLDLADCIGRVAARFDGMHPVMTVNARACLVRARREALEQALVHLVQNAVEASDPDLPVFLRVGRDARHGIVEILDSGDGMSPEFIRSRLFKPFVSSKSDGFGIGAFEARELIRAMDGRLDVESREGLGSRFFVSLPLAVDEAAVPAQHDQTKVA